MKIVNKNLTIKIIGIILIIITVILTYAFTLGVKGLKVKEYTIKDKALPNEFYGLKIVHFSDLHYGRTINKNNLESIISKINELKADIVVFTGDLVDRDTSINSSIKNILIDSLSKVESKYGNYFVGGNHDKVNKSFYEIMENSNFKNMENEQEIIYINNKTISLNGIKSSIDKKIEISLKENSPTYNVLLMHEPDNVKYIKNNDFNLILAGHSHNGQFRLPIIGKIITPKGAKTYHKEYYKLKDSNLYISSGLGTSVINVRLFNKPSINFYRLVNK